MDLLGDVAPQSAGVLSDDDVELSRWHPRSRRRVTGVECGFHFFLLLAVTRSTLSAYIGRVIWNRFRWVRSAADSSRRKRFQNSRAEWIVHEDERLRIIPQRLWERVKARQREQTDTIGERVKRGLVEKAAKHTGRGPKFLFSGLLKCGACGSNYTMASKTSYACASYVNGGGCTNDARFRRDVIESGLLDGIKRELLSPAAIEEAQRRVAKLANRKVPQGQGKAIARVQHEITNLTDAIASGALRSSPALAARLEAAERDLARLKARESQRRVAPCRRSCRVSWTSIGRSWMIWPTASPRSTSCVHGQRSVSSSVRSGSTRRRVRYGLRLPRGRSTQRCCERPAMDKS
jgi:hypothetical protein